MKEKPILFSGVMVRAILAGDKTQTRRVLKMPGWAHPEDRGDDLPDVCHIKSGCLVEIPCPYGKPGDRLWVRETWATVKTLDHLAPSKIWQHEHPPALYFAEWTGAARESPNRGKWRPSIFMPRWASRIDLDLLAVRVERLHDISDADICAELGCPSEWPGPGPEPYQRNLRGAFAATWDQINGTRAPWSSNPWVWVISFRRIEP